MKTMRSLLLLTFVGTLSSQSLMDLFTAILCLFAGFSLFQLDRVSVKKHLRLFFINPAVIAAGIWFLCAVVGFVLANPSDWPYSTERLLEFRWILILFFLTFSLFTIKFSEADLKPAAIVLILFSAYACGLYFLGFDPLKPQESMSAAMNINRTGGLIGNSMTFAHMYSLFAVLFFAISFKDGLSKEILKSVYFWAGLLTFAGVIFSFTRGVWISMTAGLLLAGFVIHRRIGSMMLGGLSLGFVLVFTVWRDFRERILYVFNPTSYDETRLWLWKAHLKIFSDNPVFGAGYGLNTRKIPEVYSAIGAPGDTLVSHAHNQFIHLLSATGIIGCAAYIFMQGYFMLIAYRTFRNSHSAIDRAMAIGLFCAMVAFNIGSLTESNFEHAKVRMALLIVWSLSLYLYLNLSKTFTNPKSKP